VTGTRDRCLQGMGESDEEQLRPKDEPDGQHRLEGNAESVEARVRTEEAVNPPADDSWR
jgi:hypothetical protein